LMMCGVALIAGCATNVANYCDVAGEIKLSRNDNITDETARIIDKEQEKFAKFCGGSK
jgi:short subunit dehydrogenase-like uncharacterized protein